MHVVAEVGVGKSVEIAEKGGERKVKVSECDSERGKWKRVFGFGFWGSRMKWPLALACPSKCHSHLFDFQCYPLFICHYLLEYYSIN